MRTVNSILKIVKAEFPLIYFIANSGNYYVLDIKEHFNKIDIKKGDFGFDISIDPELFKRVELENKALAWKNVNREIVLKSGRKLNSYMHLDPGVCIENAKEVSNNELKFDFGEQLKKLRKTANLSQEELGQKIGSSRFHISKLENNRTDPEFKTIQKIYEVGLDRK
ncbi:MAG: helix-turn-helix transcriptional regulator, partial [Acidimicrobiia bacterium]|nr:helix-turn-helix transcriptional regulator [Acidimicrobiia bacterium]